MTATAEARAAKPRFKRVKLPVHFGSVNIGEDTAAVGIRVMHEELVEDLTEGHGPAVLRAFELLCCRRLGGKLVLGRRKDGETQGKLLETDIEVTGSFDTNNLSVTPKAVGSRLSCALSEVNASELAKFAKRDGYFIITSLMESIETEPEEADDEEDEDEEGDDE